MKQIVIILLAAIFLLSLSSIRSTWLSNKQDGYLILYKAQDRQNIKEYTLLFENGKRSVERFFQSPFLDTFSIYLHPSRSSLDSTWQTDWGVPSFKSQCWMVASGVASKLDIISPKKWDSLACEHTYKDTLETQRLITHEMVHVFHGQRNISHDFSNVQGIDWFVEGLAVYASGQLDHERLSRMRSYLTNNEGPKRLQDFWKGEHKYGLSGSIVKYIDDSYGRETIVVLTTYNSITDLLATLNLSESDLISQWKDSLAG